MVRVTPPPPVGTLAATTHPLVAQYDVMHYDSEMSASDKFGTTRTTGRQTSVVTGSSPDDRVSNHKISILVAGMKPNTTYHMRAMSIGKAVSGWTKIGHQDGSNTQFPTAPYIHGDPPDSNFGYSGGGVELLSMVSSLSGYLNAVATDLQGNVIWYCPGAAIPV